MNRIWNVLFRLQLLLAVIHAFYSFFYLFIFCFLSFFLLYYCFSFLLLCFPLFFFLFFSFLFAHKGGEGYVCVQYDCLNSFFVQFLNGSLPNIAFDWKCLYNAFAVQDSKENQFVVQRSERIIVYRSSGFTPFPFYYHSLLP